MGTIISLLISFFSAIPAFKNILTMFSGWFIKRREKKILESYSEAQSKRLEVMHKIRQERLSKNEEK